MDPLHTICTTLSALFPTQTHFPGTPAYTTTNTDYYDASSILFPACIFHPHSTLDVAAALKLLTKHNIKFAVKGGGHMPGGCSNIGPEGVLISMEKMLEVEWADEDTGAENEGEKKEKEEKKTVLRVGPGNRWGSVYRKAAEKERVVVGGRRPEVGVVGLVLGGGISFLSGEYGWACDNVAGFEVVLPNSTTVYATSTNQHHDLYRALRGGASNFGLITRLDLLTHRLPLGWASLNFHAFTTTPSLRSNYITALTTYLLSGASSDPKSSAITVLLNSPQSGLNGGYTNLWRSVPESTAISTPTVFTELNALPGQTHSRNTTLHEFIESLGAASPPSPVPMHNAFRTSTFLADEALVREFVRVHDTEYASLSDVAGLTTALAFQPITPSHVLSSSSSAQARNVLGLESSAVHGTLVVTEQSVSWAESSDRERVQGVQRRVQQTMEAWAEERGLRVPWWYVNDADIKQNGEVWEGVGEENLRFLRDVGERYDPEGVGRRLWVGGFKV